MRIKDYGPTTFITGLRAWAAGGVLLVHAGGAGLREWAGLFGGRLVDLGATGVVAFFVISGFSVASSYRPEGGFGRYLFIRFMRLAPLYYFWLLVYALLLGREGYWARQLGLLPWSADLALHLFFLHAFTVQAANSILGVEWSVGVEMFWYLLLPGIRALTLRGRWLWLAALTATFLFRLVFEKRAVNDMQFTFWVRWHPLTYMVPFVLGVLAYVQRPRSSAQERRFGPSVALALFFLNLLAGTIGDGYSLPPIYIISLITFMLLVYGHADDWLCRHLFLSRPLLFLGTISYGLYLSHMFVLHFLDPLFGAGANALKFFTVLGASTLFSWATYRWLELPALEWSKRISPLVNKSAAGD
jgi:peptidoglycan/LPS O-acetylase OafA/YrhL